MDCPIGVSLDIDVLDHLVIGNGARWVSLKERGLGFCRLEMGAPPVHNLTLRF
jgi:hypothetical protein